jgi:hypothetical protein
MPYLDNDNKQSAESEVEQWIGTGKPPESAKGTCLMEVRMPCCVISQNVCHVVVCLSS